MVVKLIGEVVAKYMVVVLDRWEIKVLEVIWFILELNLLEVEWRVDVVAERLDLNCSNEMLAPVRGNFKHHEFDDFIGWDELEFVRVSVGKNTHNAVLVDSDGGNRGALKGLDADVEPGSHVEAGIILRNNDLSITSILLHRPNWRMINSLGIWADLDENNANRNLNLDLDRVLRV